MITARDLVKKFDGFTAIDHLNCTVPNGCIYGLVGVNGAGKSTFLRLAAGIYRPDGGHIAIDGGEVFDRPAVKEHFVFVPDELYFLPQSNLNRMAQLYRAAYKNFDQKRYLELVALFKLDPKKPFHMFSKGMRRQAATVLALSAKPDYVFFDETFDGLDPVMRNFVKTMLYADVADRGCTAVVTSHSMRELEDTCDQLALLYKGGVVFESDVQNLKTALFKMQIAFSEPFDKSKFEKLDIVAFSKQGSVASLIVRGDRGEAKKYVASMQPLLLELLPLTLEEVFIYELEALGYAFSEDGFKGGVWA